MAEYLYLHLTCLRYAVAALLAGRHLPGSPVLLALPADPATLLATLGLTTLHPTGSPAADPVGGQIQNLKAVMNEEMMKKEDSKKGSKEEAEEKVKPMKKEDIREGAGKVKSNGTPGMRGAKVGIKETSATKESKKEDKVFEKETEKLPEKKEAKTPPLARWSVGEEVVARWAEDGVWYRARVDARQPDGTYAVTFLDYGNQDVVAEAAMVAHREQVPEAEVGMIDEFVLEAKEKDQVEVKKVLDKEERIEKQIEKVGKKTEKVENAVAKRVEKKEEKNLEKPAETQTSVSMSPWVEGEEVLARWEEDGVWYRAKVLGVTQDGVVRVVFTDYGNEDDVVELARSVELIPDTEELDEHVEKAVTPVRAPKKAVTSLTAGAACYVLHEQLWHSGIVHALLKDDLVTVKNLDTMSFIGVNKDCVVLKVEDIPEGGRLASSATKGKKVHWKVEERCVARWSEDGVWYRAEVVAATASAFTVRFMDYGNEAEVAPADLVRCGREVPVGAEVDEHVEKVEAALKKEEPKEKVGTQRSSWVEGDEGVARWEEDGIWYRAKVLGVGMAGGVARVVFTDYGNEDDVFELARSVELLADSEVLDEHVKKSMAPVVVKEVMPKVAAAEVPSVKPQPRRTLGRPRTAEAAPEVKEPKTKGPVAASPPPPELACCVCHTVRKVSNDPFCPPG